MSNTILSTVILHTPDSNCLLVIVNAIARPSVVCLSVTLLCATQPVEIFCNFSTPFGTLAIHWQWHPPKILRRSCTSIVHNTAQNTSDKFLGVRPMLSVRCLSVCLCLSVTLVYCGQTVGWIKMKLGVEVGLGHIVLHGDPVPPPKGAQPPNVRPMLWCCGQTADWIKVPLGTEVCLRPGHNVLDGDQPPKRHSPLPIFGPCLLWPNGRPSQLLLSTCLTYPPDSHHCSDDVY